MPTQKSSSKTNLSKGFLWIFLMATFLFIDINFEILASNSDLGNIDIFNDTLGYIFGLIGSYYIISNKKVLTEAFQIFPFLLALGTIIGLLGSISNLQIAQFADPIAMISTSLIGYNYTTEHITRLKKNWIIILTAIAIAYAAPYIILLLAYLNIIPTSGDIALSGGPATLAILAFIIYFFSTIWRTYSLSKK